MFACWFTVVPPCFNTCDNPLQKGLSFFMVSLQKLYAYFHACPFCKLICKLLWHPPYRNYVIPEVFVDDGICISIADVQLVYYISDSNLSS